MCVSVHVSRAIVKHCVAAGVCQVFPQACYMGCTYGVHSPYNVCLPGMLCRCQTIPVGHSEACSPNHCNKVGGIGAGLGSGA